MKLWAEQPFNLKQLQQVLGAPFLITLVAGGTDITIKMRKSPVEQGIILDLSHVSEMKQRHLDHQGLWIGALCTMTELAESQEIRHLLPLLSKAAGSVGSTQIRNRATIGGNVGNAAQCADTIPVLMALGAKADILQASGERREMLVTELVQGIGKTALKANEVIVGFQIPAENLRCRSGYSKVGSRETVTIAKINCAAVVKTTDGIISSAQVAFGSLGAKAFLSPAVSLGLLGKIPAQCTEEMVIDLFVSQVEEAIGGRASLPYKRSAVKAVAADIRNQIAATVG